MERTVPNQFINPSSNALLFGKLQILFMKRLLLLLVLAFYCVGASAQDSRMSDATPSLMEQKSYVNALKTAEQTNRSTYSRAENVENLLYKLQSSIYYYSGVVKTYGEKPKCLFTDVRSLNALKNADMLKNNIEIVTIKIDTPSDLNLPIDMAVFSSFKNLKYIKILSYVDATEQNIKTMIRNSNDRYSVFYKIDQGENSK